MRGKVLAQALILVIATSGLTGCKSFKNWWHNTFGPKNAQQPGSMGPGTDVPPGSRPEITGNEARGQFTPVYFDYDSARIKPSEFAKIDAVAAALKGNDKKLIIEGNCDERGTAEYNRALGEKRAQAGKDALISLGIAANRITTKSLGKDNPVEASHDDTAYSRNRRDDFVVVSQ